MIPRRVSALQRHRRVRRALSRRVPIASERSREGNRLPRRRWASTTTSVKRIRNVGIVAHVDAGKTTTTERMLFYAGSTGAVGNVDDGDTVTDYLPQERERGITITSAAVSFDWATSKNDDTNDESNVQFNLIDTPGHVDFTYEVERSLRAIEGSVTIIDGVAGVQAQTLTVWRQSLRHAVAQMIFVNKLDRDGASLERACTSIRERLGVRPLVLQMPQVQDHLNASSSSSIVDLVSMELIEWSGRDGEIVTRTPLSRIQGNEVLLERAILARERLLEELAECDDDFADEYLMAMTEAEDDAVGTSIDAASVWQALRRVTVGTRQGDKNDESTTKTSRRQQQKGCAVLCGASLRNIGVQPLLDAMAKLLPSPAETSPAVVTMSKSGDAQTRRPLQDDPLCALVFKVIHTQDKQRRPLVLARVYSGEIEAGMMIKNADADKRERVLRVLQVSAGNIVESDRVSEGNIAALVGLSGTRTGDTLCEVERGKKEKRRTNEEGTARLQGMSPPPPVFTTALEGSSATEEDALRVALQHLSLEDPSIHVLSDGTGETSSNTKDLDTTLISGDSRVVVGGMGELHLELLLDRLRREYDLRDVSMSQLRVAYRESVLEQVERSYHHEQRVGDKIMSATVRVLVEPVPDDDGALNGVASVSSSDPSNCVSFERVGVAAEYDGGDVVASASRPTSESLPDTYVESALQGLNDALYSGPVLGFPVTGVRVRIRHVELGESCNANVLRACCSMAAMKTMLDASPILLEPVMRLELEMPDEKMGSVLSDLHAHRRATIHTFTGSDTTATDGGDDETFGGLASVDAIVPLPELLGYATQLRSLTGGEASYSLAFDSYQQVPDPTLKALLAGHGYV